MARAGLPGSPDRAQAQFPWPREPSSPSESFRDNKCYEKIIVVSRWRIDYLFGRVGLLFTCLHEEGTKLSEFESLNALIR